MKKLLLAVSVGVAALAAGGCASVMNTLAGPFPFQPGDGVDEAFARAWGCDPTKVAIDSERAKSGNGRPVAYIPDVGWDACVVMSHLGAPQKIDRQQSEYGRSADWWYQSQSQVHLVSLDLQNDRWKVRYVGW